MGIVEPTPTLEMCTVKAPIRLIVLPLAAALLISACGDEGDSSSESQKKNLQQDVEAVLASDVPGAVVVTAENGNQVANAWGVGDLASRTPMKVEDRFRIGSLAKSYVAVVILQLVDEGKMTLDDSVQKWLPGLVPEGEKITVRQLLNHSSGIPNYEENPKYLAPYLAGDVTHVTTPQQLVKLGTSLPRKFQPGTDASYSNTNYTVAGLIIEKVAGASLAAQFNDRIFTPLKLDSSYLPTGPDITGPHAHGYFVLGKPPATDVTRFSPSIAWAGGGIIASSGDASSFYHALLTGRLLPPELLKEMMTTVTGKSGATYGLGIVPRQFSCGTWWGHSGNFPGYLVESYATKNGQRQATIAMNYDPNSMQEKTKNAVEKLIDAAACSKKE
ncbi:serine hydrolase domain-containing protein [Streptomyces sp. NPDC056944]|uniref:serine hydrolase domain-containing protein n=1 Tax=Streptomyces sp. NPDC056944 TaxID=3345972 RepID=UPI00363CD91D